MKTAERLYNALKINKITHDDVANLIGVSQPTVGRKLSNDTFKSSEISLICRKFSISHSWLLTGDGEMMVSSNNELAEPVIVYRNEEETNRLLKAKIEELQDEILVCVKRERNATDKYVDLLEKHLK